MMRNLIAVLTLTATTVAAQPPARAPRPARPAPVATPEFPTPPTPPAPASAPYAARPEFAPLPGYAPYAVPSPAHPAEPPHAAAPAHPATPAFAPMPPMPPEPIDPAWHLLDTEQGRTIREISREQARIQAERAREISEMAREQSREQAERTRELSRMTAEIAREQAREQSQRTQEIAREQSRMQQDMAREQSRMAQEMAREGMFYTPRPAIGQGFGQGLSFSPSELPSFGPRYSLPERPPSAWAQNDPADSLWKAANDVMTKGDYRKAAAMFRELPQKHPYSVYAADAMYWTAHALYRTGGTSDLQDALQVIEQLKAKYPNSRLRGNQADVGQLQVRIAGVLNSRGQGGSEIVKRALATSAAAGGSVCDKEEQDIRSAALNALMQTDPDAATDYAKRMLAKKDDCSREMRRSAVFLIGNKRDPAMTATLIQVAKTDPSIDVRQTAVSYLGRMPGDEALAALEDMMKSSDEQQLQREAISQLARNSNPRARAGIKALVERNDVAENLRISALDALDPERSTQEDVNWLQGLYPKVESTRIRSRIINAMARIGGQQNEKWFTTLANNENESIEVRIEALRRAGSVMDIAALGRLYDQTGQRQLRMELVRQLGSRKEPESIDKLGEIAKAGTDPQVRTRAIEALSNKKDERAVKLLLQLIDRP